MKYERDTEHRGNFTARKSNSTHASLVARLNTECRFNAYDKIVQKMMEQILESIDDPLFLESSYGFRPGRGFHDAIRHLQHHLHNNANSNNHWYRPEKLLRKDWSWNTWGYSKRENQRHKVYKIYKKIFKAWVLSNGDMVMSDEGVPVSVKSRQIVCFFISCRDSFGDKVLWAGIQD